MCKEKPGGVNRGGSEVTSRSRHAESTVGLHGVRQRKTVKLLGHLVIHFSSNGMPFPISLCNRLFSLSLSRNRGDDLGSKPSML